MGFNSERRIITCCKDCPDRYPGCHGKCEKYIKERSDYDAKRSEYRKKYDIDSKLAEQRFDSIRKVTDRRNYRSKYR